VKLQIIPFRVRHLDVIKPDVTPEHRAIAAKVEKHAFTGCLLGDPVGCAGVYVDELGIGWAWTEFTPLLKAACKIQLARTVKRLLDEVALEVPIRTIRIEVDPLDNKAMQFAKWLGFNMDKPQHIYSRCENVRA